MKFFFLSFLFLLQSAGTCFSQTNRLQSPPFTEGIVYSKTTFPGHPIDSILKRIDFTKEDIDKQYNALKHSITGHPLVANDQMYMMALVLTPIVAKTYITPERSLSRIFALGYELQALLDNKEQTGRLFMQTHSLSERGTINFKLTELRKVWEKDDVGEYEGEFTEKKSQETVPIAGYPCKKITYLFSGTSQGPVAHSKIISTIPWKVTVWYSDDVTPRINVQNPFYIKLDKGILKTEAEFDKEGKKKMVYEVTRLEAKKINEDEFKLPELGEVVNHEPGGQQALVMIMNIMAAAGQISWK